MTEWPKYWDEELETMSHDKLGKFETDKLLEMVTWAYDHSALYKRKFDQYGVKPGDIKTREDISKLPLTDYFEDYCQTNVEEKLAVPMEKVKVVSSTSGTLSGFTQPVLMTEHGWAEYVNAEARARWMFGVRPDDVVQVLSGFACCERGYERLGAMTLHGHAGRRVLDHQINLAKVMGVTVLEHLPSLVLQYFKRAEELGIDIRSTRIRLVSGIGEGWANAYKKKIEKEYDVPFRTFYGSMEAVGAAECEYGGGLHILCGAGIYEVIDIETQKPCGPGEEGELVVTPLHNKAVPLIRYRTGDVASRLPYEPCPCGRTHPKLSMIRGRVSQIIRVGGKRLFPIDIEEVVATLQELGNEYQIIIDSPGELSHIKVKVEAIGERKNEGALKSRVEQAFNQSLGVDTDVEILSPGTIERTIFKAQRVIKTFN